MALMKDVLDPDYNDTKEKDPNAEVKQPFGEDSNGETDKTQPERFGTSDRSVGGRIAPVLPHLANYDFGNDDTSSDILGKQIELEAGNAIQYRTCSWPKVSFHLPTAVRGQEHQDP